MGVIKGLLKDPKEKNIFWVVEKEIKGVYDWNYDGERTYGEKIRLREYLGSRYCDVEKESLLKYKEVTEEEIRVYLLNELKDYYKFEKDINKVARRLLGKELPEESGYLDPTSGGKYHLGDQEFGKRYCVVKGSEQESSLALLKEINYQVNLLKNMRKNIREQEGKKMRESINSLVNKILGGETVRTVLLKEDELPSWYDDWKTTSPDGEIPGRETFEEKIQAEWDQEVESEIKVYTLADLKKSKYKHYVLPETVVLKGKEIEFTIDCEEIDGAIEELYSECETEESESGYDCNLKDIVKGYCPQKGSVIEFYCSVDIKKEGSEEKIIEILKQSGTKGSYQDILVVMTNLVKQGYLDNFDIIDYDFVKKH